MPAASEYASSEFVKLMFIGSSGSGKTGALTSLVKAGYKLRIIDLDNGLDALINHVKEADPKLLSAIEFQTYRDRMKMTATGPRVAGAPRAYASVLDALERWPDDESDPAEWGSEYVLVLDSLTNLGQAAFNWAKAIDPSNKDPRRWYKNAQDLVADCLTNLTSASFRTNVIVISHIEITDQNGLMKGYPSAIGKALGPKIPKDFNTLLVSQVKGTGEKMKRQILTVPTGFVDAKNPAPMRIAAEYEISDGLDKIFKATANNKLAEI